jgi:hypothetical protein
MEWKKLLSISEKLKMKEKIMIMTYLFNLEVFLMNLVLIDNKFRKKNFINNINFFFFFFLDLESLSLNTKG